jgi:SAM-dependent methyltransferase
MNRRLLEILACPACQRDLRWASQDGCDGDLSCSGCATRYAVRDGIPRFVPSENYADNFGLQWNHFDKTQLDSHTGTDISRRRLEESTGWDWSAMKGKLVLDVGCGAGRFAEAAALSGAHVVGVDFSSAVDAACRNLSSLDNFAGVQASVFALPFKPESFDYVYCLGVLQHTPDPEAAFRALAAQIAPGGGLAVDLYPRLLRNALWSKYWLRPLTRRIPDRLLFRAVVRLVPALLAVSRLVARVPRLGPKLRYLVPVANYTDVYDLTDSQLREWAVLDTFDMLAPEHDHPQSERTVRRWFSANQALEGVVVFRRGHIVAQARKVDAQVRGLRAVNRGRTP